MIEKEKIKFTLPKGSLEKINKKKNIRTFKKRK